MRVVIKITFCKDGQLICLGGHFEKAVFTVCVDRFIWHCWVHCARCTLQDNERRGTRKKAQRLSRQHKCPSGGLAAGAVF